MAEIAITSGWQDGKGLAPAGAFRLADVPDVAVVVEKAEDRGLRKCARSWRYTADVGDDREFPEVSARDAKVLHELQALGRF
jgi:isoleucyl-tRNA synthetase